MTTERPIDPFLVAEVPPGLVEFVCTLCRANSIAERIVERASHKVLRRLRHHPDEAKRAAARRARWESRWLPENRASTMQWLGQIRDEVVRQHHQENVAQHATFATLPDHLHPWRLEADGTLVIDEPAETTPSFGSNAYLEQTPLKLLRWVHETWLSHQLDEVGEDVGLDWSAKPKVWDLTAGSGTSIDYFGCLNGCDVIASDLTVVALGVEACDARRFGTLHARRRRRAGDLTYSTVVAPVPDIILFDPPSRGLPLHAQLYGVVPKEVDMRDFGLLERADWISAVADIAAESTACLADDGFVSLLLRCGLRFHGDVVADVELLAEFTAALPNEVVVTHAMPLAYRTVRNQASLGQARLPAFHLTLERRA